MNLYLALALAAALSFGIAFGLGYVVIPFLHKLSFKFDVIMNNTL